MPQWFCWYRRSGLLGHRRTQCGSWKVDVGGVEAFDHFQALDQRRASCGRRRAIRARRRPTCAKYRCAGSRGSTMIECSFGPSGVPSCTVPIHSRYCGSSLMPENGAQVTPPSSERNRPCGEVPAYQTSGSLAWPGVSQKVWSTARPVSPVGGLGEGRRPRGFLPGAAEIGGAEDGRAEVAGLRRRQQGAAVARVEHAGG